MTWGAQLPDDIKQDDCSAVWGARAIFTPFKQHCIDLLPDRQSVRCGDEDNTACLLSWLNTGNMKKLSRAVQNMSTSSDEVVDIRDGLFGIRATPGGSYGYLYIVAWRLKTEAEINDGKTGTVPVVSVGD